MRELLDLFWPLGRERLSKYVRGLKSGRGVVYPSHEVVELMGALLSEPLKERKQARGKAPRMWLNDPADPELRTRVLSGIDAYLKSLASELWEAFPDRAQEWQEWQTEIADPILKVLRPYLSDSAE
jgi:hypothetical protein